MAGTDGKRNKNKRNAVSNKANKVMRGSPDTKYLHYPHVEGVTQKGSLLLGYLI